MADQTALVEALGLGERAHVALVGGGGKTTLLHALGHQLEGSTILTTTTRMGHDQAGGFPVVAPDADPVGRAQEETILVWSRLEEAKTSTVKARGVGPEDCDRWASLVDYVVVEADGSRQRPFKAPGPMEPVVPITTTHLISVIGADALGRVIADQCHRPQRVAALAGCDPYRRLSPAYAATVLLHPNGARRACPERAVFSVVITKVDDDSRPLVEELVAELLAREPDLPVVLMGQFSHHLQPSSTDVVSVSERFG